MKLSILVPGIRTSNWLRLYQSVNVHDFWEIIFVGPYAPPKNLTQENVKYIHSWRSPTACQQIALHYAKGQYISWAADDGFFMPNSLNETLNWIEGYDYPHEDNNVAIVGRYLEGDNPIGMVSQDYYRFKYHKPYRLAGVPQECLIFNCGIIKRDFLTSLGGWDAENFEVPTIAHADLGIRAYKAGAHMVLSKEVMFKCSHQPGKSGDHAPIHNAQIKHDLPRFKEIYSKPNDRVNIELENWKYTEEIWGRRFK